MSSSCIKNLVDVIHMWPTQILWQHSLRSISCFFIRTCVVLRPLVPLLWIWTPAVNIK
jgi:hypothetical protein